MYKNTKFVGLSYYTIIQIIEKGCIKINIQDVADFNPMNSRNGKTNDNINL